MIYLDYNASTPVDQRVLDAAVEVQGLFGNPSSIHHIAGAAASDRVETAREQVASLFRRPSQDVIFTSGATEAAAIGLIGAMLGAQRQTNVVVSATEHKAILAAAELGARLNGGEVRVARVDSRGVVELNHLETLMDDSVGVVAVMAANNETGVLAPVTEVADIAQRSGTLTFVDVTQLAGKGSLIAAMNSADIAVCSSHKVYGPKGAGALLASRAVQKRIVPLLAGGGQERGLRGGTQNTASIVGFGLAAQLAEAEASRDENRLRELSGQLLSALNRGLPEVRINGEGAERLSNTLNLRFVGADGEAVMASMPHVCVSSGSACQSASSNPSHVLVAMGRSRIEAEESIRISLGRPTTAEQVSLAAAAIIDAVSRVRELTAA